MIFWLSLLFLIPNLFFINLCVYSVVTGVKFEKKNETLYIKIQQGQILPHGFIKKNTITWKSVMLKNNKIHHYDDTITSKNQTEKKFKIEWFENRGLLLDNLLLPNNRVITGVRFNTVKIQSHNYLRLEVQSTFFNPRTGKLLANHTDWFSVKKNYDRQVNF